MVKISVIIPAYNVGKYIRECIESVQGQTLRDIEILVVNDGSTDNTKSIIEDLQKKDKRIKIINKENEGILPTRGVGYNNSNGKYILYVDGDDWIESTCCEKLYNKIIKDDADIAICNFNSVYRKNKIIGSGGSFTYLNKNEYLESFLIGNVSCYLWTRLMKRDVLKNIDFNKKISLGDDTYINIKTIQNVNKVTKIDEPLINYRVREGSLTKKYDKSIYEIWNIINEIKNDKFITKNDEFNDAVDYFIYNHVLIGRVIDKTNNLRSIHKDMYDLYKKEGIRIYKNKYYKENTSLKHKILTRAYLINYFIGIRLGAIIVAIQRVIKGKNESFQC